MSLHENELELLKDLFKVIIYSFEEGACFLVVDLDKVTFKMNHRFDIAGLDVGAPYNKSDVAVKIFETGTTVKMQLPSHESGGKVSACGGPIWDASDTKIIGAWVLVKPV